MTLNNNLKVCNGCIHSSLHHCKKYNEVCLSMRFHNERYQMICSKCIYEKDYLLGDKKIEKLNPNAFFRVPGLHNFNAFKSLKKMSIYYPEVFIPQREIIQIYDAFPGASWNGRQANYLGQPQDLQTLIKLRDDIEQNNFSFNLTWNNNLITQEDCFDRYCNMITSVFHTGKHSITVSSSILFQYLKDRYPNYTFYQSVISDVNDGQELILDKKYDKIVLNRKLNNNWEILTNIPIEQRDKIEILCNDTCTPWCKRMVHYNLDNKFILERQNPPDYIRDYCMMDHDFMSFNNSHWDCTVDTNNINKYTDLGYKYFKLCSRSDTTPELLIKILPYFVKPEYFSDVFRWALNGIIVPETKWEGYHS